jgi:hypothetical protein
MHKLYAPVLFLCSLAMGALLFFSLRGLPLSGAGGLEGYAALGLDAAIPDREAAGALEAALGRPVVSASSQWVLLNSFGGLERVPLEDYGERLEPFDPRRDGYAEKLANFFVRDGRRWFFIPLDRKLFGLLPPLNPGEGLKKRISAALDSLPPAAPARAPGASSGSFSLLLKPRGRPWGRRILLFVLAWTAAFLLSQIRARPGQGRPDSRRRFFRAFPGGPEGRRLLLLAPLMLPLSLWGPPGFAFIALFLLLGALLAEPLGEWWIRFPGKASLRRGPYRSRFLYSLPLILLLAFISWLGALPPLRVFLNFLGLSLIYCSSLGLDIHRKISPPREGQAPYGPRRFVPLPILPPRFSPPRANKKTGRRELLAFPPGRKNRGNPALPFALASCLAAFLGGAAPSSLEWPFLVQEEDYRAHILFQAGFAHRSLQPPAGDPADYPGYFRYTLGEDGLVAGALPLSPEGLEIPPFPLADLTDHLAAWGAGEREGTGEKAGGRGIKASLRPALPLGDLVSPFLAFLLVFPGLAGRARGWKKAPAYYEKRIAA